MAMSDDIPNIILIYIQYCYRFDKLNLYYTGRDDRWAIKIGRFIYNLLILWTDIFQCKVENFTNRTNCGRGPGASERRYEGEASIFSFFKIFNFAMKDFWFNYKETVHLQTQMVYAAIFCPRHPDFMP